MCSVNEIEQAGDIVKSKKGSKRRDKANKEYLMEEGACMKCGEKAVVLVRNNDPFCTTCFLEYAVHKFRATIGKARVIHQGEKVLLAVSGGSSSGAMLDLVIKGLGKAALKKHRFQPGVIYMDDEGLCGQTAEARNRIKNHIQELALSAGFPFHYASLTELVMIDDEMQLVDSLKDVDLSNEEKSHKASPKILTQLFEKVTTVTAKDDLLSHLYRNQLQRIAKDHSYNYIMVGDCGTNISIRILADIVQGRGSQLPFSVGFKDGRSEVSVLRPMREFTKKEIEYYNYFSNVNSFAIPSFSTKASSHSSVTRLTEELILGLQASFPSTVNTVLKTGDKISSNIGDGNSKHCTLCLAPLDMRSGFSGVFNELSCESGACGSNGCQETSNDGSTAHTRSADGGCQNTDDGDDVILSGTDEDGGGCQNTGGCTVGSLSSGNSTTGDHVHGDQKVHSNSVEQSTNDNDILSAPLCYGCRLTYNDMGDAQHLLPKYLTNEHIKSFLINK
ncbi:cytoplasmic tRNA 2-thiolation protein 2-B-like [Dendronephthya gigantea]|uniref:cytoplasmic tRNA 2-thiolation protein 2-B-like n=1 Tax=Dendronephthya gigantea TaxID=151771 RepID=UPI00106A6412|nr:cytoplasmic tRNA 2-thiolation protein 2-B-like [Dendronephthya gigantea]